VPFAAAVFGWFAGNVGRRKDMRLTRHQSVASLGVLGLLLACGQSFGGVKALYTNIQTSPTSLIPGGGGLRFNTGTQTQFDRPYVSANGLYFIMTAISETPLTTDDEVIVVGQLSAGSITAANMVAREQTTAIEPGRTAESASIGRNAAINNMGQFVFQANLTGATTDDEVIVKGSNFMAPAFSVAAREVVEVARAGSAALMLGAKNVVYSMFFLEEEAFYANHAV
jgi:hypothetical protein